jgi:hypothetical protein
VDIAEANQGEYMSRSARVLLVLTAIILIVTGCNDMEDTVTGNVAREPFTRSTEMTPADGDGPEASVEGNEDTDQLDTADLPQDLRDQIQRHFTAWVYGDGAAVYDTYSTECQELLGREFFNEFESWEEVYGITEVDTTITSFFTQSYEYLQENLQWYKENGIPPDWSPETHIWIGFTYVGTEQLSPEGYRLDYGLRESQLWTLEEDGTWRITACLGD